MSKGSEEKDSRLPVRHVIDVEEMTEDKRWLIRSLWTFGVGVVGGLPKSLKTWIATELSYSVATGEKALGSFDVEKQGPVLVFQAEDDLPSMRGRFEAIANARGGRLKDVPIFLLDVPVLHLDDGTQLQALRKTVDHIKPRLLVLDPFVRLVRTIDENSAAEVSAILGALREIQRTFDVAILLVHHMRKAPSANLGQQLRGSGDFSAWSDSAIYITKNGDDRCLTIEHRAAKAPPPVCIRLHHEPAPHLIVVDDKNEPGLSKTPLALAILERLRLVPRPHSTATLRIVLKVRKASLIAALDALVRQGLITKTQTGWALVSNTNIET